MASGNPGLGPPHFSITASYHFPAQTQLRHFLACLLNLNLLLLHNSADKNYQWGCG
jgi:hypothetical protein